jgi:hypothetical protein
MDHGRRRDHLASCVSLSVVMQFIAARFDRLSAQEHYGIIQQTCPSPLIPRPSFGANAATGRLPAGRFGKVRPRLARAAPYHHLRSRYSHRPNLRSDADCHHTARLNIVLGAGTYRALSCVLILLPSIVAVRKDYVAYMQHSLCVLCARCLLF